MSLREWIFFDDQVAEIVNQNSKNELSIEVKFGVKKVIVGVMIRSTLAYSNSLLSFALSSKFGKHFAQPEGVKYEM